MLILAIKLRDSGGYQVYFQLNFKRYYVGIFDTLEEAEKVDLQAREMAKSGKTEEEIRESFPNKRKWKLPEEKQRKSIIGKRFERLVVVDEFEVRDSGKLDVYCNCQCDCGNTTTVLRNSLIINNVKSCGCLNQDMANNLIKTANYKKYKKENYKDGTCLSYLNNRPRKNSKSGVKGVRYCEKTKRWKASIQISRKKYNLSGFETKEEAVLYRKIAEKILWNPVLETGEIKELPLGASELRLLIEDYLKNHNDED